MRIRAKLISVSIFLVLFPLLAVAALSMFRFGTALRNASEEDLEHLVRNIYSMCKVQQEMLQMKVVSDLNVAKDIMYKYGHEVTVHPENIISFRAVNQSTGSITPLKVPAIMIGNTLIS